MEWLGDLLGVGASAASGGLFGLAGSLIGGVFKYFQAKQEHRQRLEWAAVEMDQARLDMEADQLRADNEAKLIAAQGSWDSLQSSYAHDSGGSSHKWANDVRSLYRPILTSGLLVMVFMIWRDISSGGDGMLLTYFTQGELKEVIRYIVMSVVFTASTAAVWWFGDRAFAPPGFKNR